MICYRDLRAEGWGPEDCYPEAEANKVTTAKEVEPGMIVWAHGYRWIVRENRFDPHGNTGTQARHILVCDAVGDTSTLPSTYATRMTLGYLPNAQIRLAQD